MRAVLFLGDEFRPAVAGTNAFYDALRLAGVRVELRKTAGPHVAATFAGDVLELLNQQPE